MKHITLILISAILLLSTIAHAYEAKDLDYGDFKQIPILNEGRIKPLDSFARIQLKRLTGGENFHGKPAIEWLAATLFEPTSEEQPIITIQDKALREQLGLPADQKTFSLRELQPALRDSSELAVKLATQDKEEELSQTQNNLLKLHAQANTLHNLHRAFSLLYPLPITAPDSADTEKENTYRDLKPALTENQKKLLAIIKRKGENIQKYNDKEKAIALFTFQLEQIRQDGLRADLFKILPYKDTFLAPWIYNESLDIQSPENEARLALWQELLTAYRANDNASWQQASAKLLTNTAQFTPKTLGLNTLWLENLYYKLKPFNLALGLFALCALFSIATLSHQAGYSKIKPASFWPQATLAAATLCLMLGITTRVVILGRPPVSTLYESTLFVTAIMGILGLIIAHKQVSTVITLLTAILGFGLLLLSPILIKNGESMEMLVAVLNTNFWLATHVIIITMGYGVCILSASLAHITMLLRTIGAKTAAIKTMATNSYKTALGALLLTTIGTILGGIWADQSWGRFWGWDPKENGALMIVLWLIWILHGRMSGKLKELSFAALLAALNIIVALTWFGVNLLGVGLHSYGFTSGLALGLFIFCTAELLLIATLTFFAHKKKA